MSYLEQLASKVTVSLSGQEGTKSIFAIDDNKIVTTVDMKNGTYTIAAQPTSACLISVKHTAVGTIDTLGTIAVVGSLNGVSQSEAITPVNGQTVYSTKEYDTITSLTGAGWIVDAVEGTKDTIIVGVADIIAPSGYYFCAIKVLATAVVASQTALTGSMVADFSKFTGLPVGTYETKLEKIALTSGEAIGYLTKKQG